MNGSFTVGHIDDSGSILCLNCTDDWNVEWLECLQPILAGTKWDSPPLCQNCLTRIEGVSLTGCYSPANQHLKGLFIDWLKKLYDDIQWSDIEPDDSGKYVDIRLRMIDQDEFDFRHGLIDYDTDHTGLCGASYLPWNNGDKADVDFDSIADGIIDDLDIAYYENGGY